MCMYVWRRYANGQTTMIQQLFVHISTIIIIIMSVYIWVIKQNSHHQVSKALNFNVTKGDFCLLLNLACCIYFLIFKTRDRERREFRLLANLITILLTNLLKPVWDSKVNLGKKSIVIEHHLL